MDLEMRKNMLRCYYANNNSATAAMRQYKRENNLIKDPCSVSSITRMIDKFERTGSLHDEKHGRNSQTDERKETVENIVEDSHAMLSVRRVSQESGIPSTSVFRIMKQALNLKPYRFKMLQSLEDQDYDQRRAFGNWFYQNSGRIKNVLWSDEAYLHLNGDISRYHCRIWSQNNPREFITKPLHPQKICIWIGFTSTFSIKPFFFDGIVTSESYLNMLQNHLRPNLVQKRKLSSTIFQQDGAPSHFATCVRDYLQRTFGAEKVISRGFDAHWPARSPDLSPVDYCFWGTLKARVFHQNPPSSLEQLKQRVEEECGRFTADEFSNAVGDLPHRINLMMQENGKHFEHLL